MGKEGQKSSKQQPPQQFTFMNTRSEVSAETALQMEECLEGVEKYDMERFINPVTRERTFKMLFDEVLEFVWISLLSLYSTTFSFETFTRLKISTRKHINFALNSSMMLQTFCVKSTITKRHTKWNESALINLSYG